MCVAAPWSYSVHDYLYSVAVCVRACVWLRMRAQVSCRPCARFRGKLASVVAASVQLAVYPRSALQVIGSSPGVVREREIGKAC